MACENDAASNCVYVSQVSGRRRRRRYASAGCVAGARRRGSETMDQHDLENCDDKSNSFKNVRDKFAFMNYFYFVRPRFFTLSLSFLFIFCFIYLWMLLGATTFSVGRRYADFVSWSGIVCVRDYQWRLVKTKSLTVEDRVPFNQFNVPYRIN